jgi:hypothetical protein
MSGKLNNIKKPGNTMGGLSGLNSPTLIVRTVPTAPSG